MKGKHEEAVESLQELDCVSEVEKVYGYVRIWTEAHTGGEHPTIYAVGELETDTQAGEVWNVLFRRIQELGYRTQSVGLNEERDQFCVAIDKEESQE